MWEEAGATYEGAAVSAERTKAEEPKADQGDIERDVRAAGG